MNPYLSFLDSIEKPARYIGGEHFSCVKTWSADISKVALCFPDTYEVGMSYLGFKILYEELNNDDEILAERSFAPWIDMEREIRKRELKLVSLENFKPLCDFDILGFSLQYEMTYTNILNMLDLGGVSIFQKDRGENDPFVVCGGPCATHPEPLSDFVDFFLIGDGEIVFSHIIKQIKKLKNEGKTRSEILEQVSKNKGVYVPSLYEIKECKKSGYQYIEGNVQSIKYDGFLNSLGPMRTPIPHMTTIFDRYSVEISRGCSEGCRFCQAGMIYRPKREKHPDAILESIDKGLSINGIDDVSLTSLSTSDYSAITPLLLKLIPKLKKENKDLGISSLRVHGLEEEILDKLVELKNNALTIAPEAGSQKLRDIINKNITEDDLLTSARNLYKRGWKKLKLYFMIGLPLETDEDVESIMSISSKVKNVARECGERNPQVTVSVSSFIPKPHTPFQWCEAISLEEIKRRQEILWQLSKKYKLTLKKHDSRVSYLESVIARGDRRVGSVIFESWKSGARLDGWTELFDMNIWMNSFEILKIDPEFYRKEIPIDAHLPWDFIDIGVNKKYLLSEREDAFNQKTTAPCMKFKNEYIYSSNLKNVKDENNKIVCHACGTDCSIKNIREQRTSFLESVGSYDNSTYVRPIKIKKTIKEKREQRGQEVGITYRVKIAKVGAISFISNLDLQKVVARIFKRAKLEIFYSEGHNQRPLLAFGAALPIGVSSFCEYFDVRVPVRWNDINSILSLLQNNSESGIIFKEAFEITRKTLSVQQMTKSFEYFLPLLKSDDIKEKINILLEAEEINISSFSKKDKKEVIKNIRPFILSVESSEFEIEVGNKSKGIFVTVAVINGSSIRTRELVSIFSEYGIEVATPLKINQNLDA